jgi:transposase
MLNVNVFLAITKKTGRKLNCTLQGIDALQPKEKGRPSMKKGMKELKSQTLVEGSLEALQAEVERLRMENAYLKKLNALVQNKEKPPNKT